MGRVWLGNFEARGGRGNGTGRLWGGGPRVLRCLDGRRGCCGLWVDWPVGLLGYGLIGLPAARRAFRCNAPAPGRIHGPGPAWIRSACRWSHRLSTPPSRVATVQASNGCEPVASGSDALRRPCGRWFRWRRGAVQVLEMGERDQAVFGSVSRDQGFWVRGEGSWEPWVRLGWFSRPGQDEVGRSESPASGLAWPRLGLAFFGRWFAGACECRGSVLGRRFTW